MNQLSIEKRTQIIQLLVEGNSIRATTRITGCSKNTVTKLLVEVGQACVVFHDQRVTGLKVRRIQCDEIWSFVYSKQKNVVTNKQEVDGAGDVWTWTAIDADTKLIIGYLVGDRGAETANLFMQDLASRITTKVQLTTDGHKAYLQAVENNFDLGGVDYAMLMKIYGSGGGEAAGKYSPAEVTGIKKTKITGNPNMKDVSTSYVERQNLTMRMQMRRFTRLTNAFSKKVENHWYAIALHFVYYNFCRIHKTLRVTPAMEAGLMKNIMSIEDIVRLTDQIKAA